MSNIKDAGADEQRDLEALKPQVLLIIRRTTMSRSDRETNRQRANFVLAVRRARCPKDGGRILEVAMPEVICEKCSTTYNLAMQIGTLMLHTKLIEKQPAQPQIIREKEVTQREIVRIPCKYCGSLNDLATDKFCSRCGAPIK